MAPPLDEGDTLPRVSVVIPVLNGEDMIRECLGSLLRLDYPVARREILIVDNGSTDRTAEIIREFPVRYLREEERGPSKARNLGIVKSQGDIVAFTDVDCVPTRGWLQELVRGFQSAEVGGVAGEIRPIPGDRPARRWSAWWHRCWRTSSASPLGKGHAISSRERRPLPLSAIPEAIRMSAELPLASVVVAALDDDGLPECLASLASVRYPKERREVLVVGADPSGGTERIAERYPFTYLRASRRSVTVARNRGIEASRGDIIALTDPDCMVTTAWLGSLAGQFVGPKVGMVAGGIVPYPGDSLAERYMARRRSRSQERSLRHPDRPFAMTPNLAIRRDVFERIGLFDTRFVGGGWEDADLCWRMRNETGLQIRFAPEAPVLHRYRTTIRGFFVQQYGYGLAVLLRKYPSELPADWYPRARALGGVGPELQNLLVAGGRFLRGTRTDSELGLSCLALLRQVAQRGGFWSAAIQQR